MREKKMKICITGVAGLLGSRLADYLVEHHPETEVFGIDNLSGGDITNVHEKVKFHKLDLVTDDLSELFKEGFSYVFHFAAYAAEGLSPFVREFNYKNNLIATTRIVNECIKTSVDRLVFTSSMAVYGKGNPPFTETDLPDPIDPYGVAKLACEQDIMIAGEQHNLDWCIIRPHNVYGIKQNIWDKYRNVLGIWMYQHLRGKPMTIFGDGEQTRAFSFIDDCLAPLWKSATSEKASKQIINLGGTQSYSINEANEALRNVIKDGTTVYLEARHEVKEAHPTWKKSVELLDYAQSTSLQEGLQIMWDWAKEQPDRGQFLWEEYELDKGIYEYWKN
jgi:UDP-glucose 4-epimerase